MVTLLAVVASAIAGVPVVDPGLPARERTLMREVLSPDVRGEAFYVDKNGTAHCNRVGGLEHLIKYRPVPGQPGVYTDGEESFAVPGDVRRPPPRPIVKTVHRVGKAKRVPRHRRSRRK